MSPVILGIHHITALASDPKRNFEFYTQFLGLRLVKKTVNFDDPGTYHLYFGDEKGSPGSILTFFPWPGARRGRHGSGQVTLTSFAVPKGSLAYWFKRAEEFRIDTATPTARFESEALTLFDPDGLKLELVESLGVPENPADISAGLLSVISPQYAIGKIHSATISEEGFEQTAQLLTGVLGFRLTAERGNRFHFEIGEAGTGSVLEVLCNPDAPHGEGGAGVVHHIAWRTPDDQRQMEWRQKLVELGYNVSPIMDRQYFHSIYFREPGGVLFEIATDPPGFMVDEAFEELGSTLKLPPALEPIRSRVEHVLPKL